MRRRPVRTCVGCRRSGPSDTLVRVGRTDDGRLSLDPGIGGRGAWLCLGSRECFDRARRTRAFGRALRAEVDPASLDEIEVALAGRFGDRWHEGVPGVRG